MATHALIPGPWRDALNSVVFATGTPQRELVSDAVAALLAKAGHGFIPDAPKMPRGGLVALVARIPKEQQDALHALADRTRIRYSEWLRQAVVDVIRKHGQMPEVALEPPGVRQPRLTPKYPRGGEGRCGCGFRLLPGEVAPCQDCREAA